MQRAQPSTHPRRWDYAPCFQAPGSSEHHSWLWQASTAPGGTLPSPHTRCWHGWRRFWVYHHCSAVKSGRDISEGWIQRWNLSQWHRVSQINLNPGNTGLEESTLAEVLWMLGAWFESLKPQGGAQLDFIFFHSTPASTWCSLRGAGWRVLVAWAPLQLWCIKEDLQQPKPGARGSQANWMASNWDWRRDAPSRDLEHKSHFYILLHYLEDLFCLLTKNPSQENSLKHWPWV